MRHEREIMSRDRQTVRCVSTVQTTRSGDKDVTDRCCHDHASFEIVARFKGSKDRRRFATPRPSAVACCLLALTFDRRSTTSLAFCLRDLHRTTDRQFSCHRERHLSRCVVRLTASAHCRLRCLRFSLSSCIFLTRVVVSILRRTPREELSSLRCRMRATCAL